MTVRFVAVWCVIFMTLVVGGAQVSLAGESDAGSGRATGDAADARATADAADGRATVDQPDELRGPQVHVMYVLPSDGVDQGLDTNGAITSSVAAFQRWFADQTAGRWLRIDTAGGVPDVTFHRIGATAEQIATAGAAGAPDGTQLVNALASAGFSVPDKVYLVYFGGTSNFACSATSLSSTGTVATIYLANQPPRCRYAPLPAGWPALSGAQVPEASVIDYVAAHETLHLLGFVPSCAPHHAGAGDVSDDRNDLMSGRYVEPIVLDRRHDDYFEANLPGCPDLSTSPFLTPAVMHPVTATVIGGGRVRMIAGTREATCAPTCTQTFPLFATVRFVTVAEPGFELDGWEDDCAGGGGCAVYVDGPKSVTARFVRERVQIRVGVEGKGRVSGGPFACPPRCTASLPSDSRLRLVARPASGWRFVRWRGACSGSKPCVVQVAAPAAIRAQFRRRP